MVDLRNYQGLKACKYALREDEILNIWFQLFKELAPSNLLKGHVDTSYRKRHPLKEQLGLHLIVYQAEVYQCYQFIH